MNVNITNEAVLYEQVYNEIKRGEINKGIWLKALTDAIQDVTIAESLYVKYMVDNYKEQLLLKNEMLKKQKNELNDSIHSIIEKVIVTLPKKYKVLPGNTSAWLSAASYFYDSGDLVSAYFWSFYAEGRNGKFLSELKINMASKEIEEAETMIKSVHSVGGLNRLASFT